MRKNDLYSLFIDELSDMYDSEKQIIKSLPKMIKLASLEDLKDALSNHLEETKFQVQRLEQIFAMLNQKIESNSCEAMEGLLKEADELVFERS